MSYQLPEKLRGLAPYEPLSGEFQIRLDANESFLAPPPELLERIGRVVTEVAFNRYPDPNCTTLCRRFGDYFGVEPERVVAGNGSDELIQLIETAFLSAGDPMVVVRPDFSMYAFYAQLIGAQVRVFEKEANRLALDADALIAFARAQGAKLLIFSNPCNPTSLQASREEMLRIAAGLPDCLVVADEAYMDFSQGSLLQAGRAYENLVILKTCSKAFGMAAIRLGFAVGSLPVIRALKAAKSPYNVNSMTQAVGSLLLGERAYLQDCTARIKAARDMLYQQLCQLSQRKQGLGTPVDTCANFVFLPAADPKGIFDALREQGVAIRLMGDYLRITAGTEAENRELLRLLDAATESIEREG